MAREAEYYDSHSIKDLGHNQSLLAYQMNGEPLPVLHGAPLRLRVENQLGFKQVKWIKEIQFVRHFSERGASQGGYNEDHGAAATLLLGLVVTGSRPSWPRARSCSTCSCTRSAGEQRGRGKGAQR